MNIAVIPARGGSKRVPRKNIRPFGGKPMLAWAVEAALESGVFGHVLVSTDDEEIAQVARGCGAEVPFVRPPELSNDEAGTTEVIAHATQWSRSQGWAVDAVCCIYPTAAFVRPDDLRHGLVALQSGDWAYAFSATDYASPVFRAFAPQPEGGVQMFFPENFHKRSQELPVAWHDAAQFYWGRPDAWTGGLPIFELHSTAVFIPRWRVQDIDTPEDWTRAELMFRALHDAKEGA